MSAPPHQHTPPDSRPSRPDQDNQGTGFPERQFGGWNPDENLPIQVQHPEHVQPQFAEPQGVRINDRFLTPSSQELNGESKDAALKKKKVDRRKLPPVEYKKVIGPGKKAKTKEEKEQRRAEAINRNRKSAGRSRQKKKEEERKKAAEFAEMKQDLASYRGLYGPSPHRSVGAVIPPISSGENSSEPASENVNFHSPLPFHADKPTARNSCLANDGAVPTNHSISQPGGSVDDSPSCLPCKAQHHNRSPQFGSSGYFGTCDTSVDAENAPHLHPQSAYRSQDTPADVPNVDLCEPDALIVMNGTDSEQAIDYTPNS